jgi:hypothetical protein
VISHVEALQRSFDAEALVSLAEMANNVEELQGLVLRGVLDLVPFIGFCHERVTRFNRVRATSFADEVALAAKIAASESPRTRTFH